MFRNSKTARIVAVLLLSVLLPGSLAAAGRPVPEASSWSLGAALWGSVVRAACAVIGDGCPLPPAAASGCDRGSVIDPDGRCATAVTTAASGCDRGSMVDPNGRCAP